MFGPGEERGVAVVAAWLGGAAALGVGLLRGPAVGLALAAGAGLSLVNFSWLVAGAYVLVPDAGVAPLAPRAKSAREGRETGAPGTAMGSGVVVTPKGANVAVSPPSASNQARPRLAGAPRGPQPAERKRVARRSRAGARANQPSGEAGARGGGIARFLGRFALLGAAVYAIFISHLLPVLPLILGLFAVPAAVMGVGARLLWTGR